MDHLAAVRDLGSGGRMERQRAHEKCAAAGSCAGYGFDLLPTALDLLVCQSPCIVCSLQHLNRAICLVAIIQMQAHCQHSFQNTRGRLDMNHARFL